MKYIRTKDGIYEATEINGMVVARGDVAYSCDIADVHFPIVFKEKDIIKQADTIDELCDEFVVKYTDNSMSVFCSQGLIRENGHITFEETRLDLNEFLDYLIKEENETIKEIYGAIWIKGKHNEPILKSVAKTNEEGKLELL